MTLPEARESLCYADQLAVMFPNSRACQKGRRIAWEMWWKAVRIAWGASQFAGVGGIDPQEPEKTPCSDECLEGPKRPAVYLAHLVAVEHSPYRQVAKARQQYIGGSASQRQEDPSGPSGEVAAEVACRSLAEGA